MRKLVLAFAALYLAAQPVLAQQQGGFDSGSMASASATPSASSHAAGVSVGGLFSVPIARVAGGGGTVRTVLIKSVGGSIAAMTVRMWDVQPANTTCTDNTNYAGSDTDDQHLIAQPFTITPAAPAQTTGDSATYGQSAGLTVSFHNQDASPSKNVYLCLVANATDTADESHIVRVTLLGSQD